MERGGRADHTAVFDHGKEMLGLPELHVHLHATVARA